MNFSPITYKKLYFLILVCFISLFGTFCTTFIATCNVYFIFAWNFCWHYQHLLEFKQQVKALIIPCFGFIPFLIGAPHRLAALRPLNAPVTHSDFVLRSDNLETVVTFNFFKRHVLCPEKPWICEEFGPARNAPLIWNAKKWNFISICFGITSQFMF